MARPHPNYTKMTAAVAGWIAAAATHPEGARLLRQRADRVEQQLQELARTAERDQDAPLHLRGLTAVDLICAHGDLLAAANAHRVAA